jgi:DNA-binding LytR/AlgR family response regulator
MKMEDNNSFFIFKALDGIVQFPLYKISYIHSLDGKIKVFFDDGNYMTLFETMKGLEENLRDFGFVRIHQNCIINLRQELIFCAKTRTITLSNECIINVAKERLSIVKQVLLQMSIRSRI